MRTAGFDLGGDKDTKVDDFFLSFFLRFQDVTEDDAMEFIAEFHSRSCLSKHIHSSIALILKKMGAESIRNFRLIRLIADDTLIFCPVEEGRFLDPCGL